MLTLSACTPQQVANLNAITIGCLEGNCQNGMGIMAYEDFTYQGAFKEGFFHGKGILRYDDGTYYEGEFIRHQQHGQGYYKSVNEDWSYRGDFFEGKFQGQGVLLQDSSVIYTGAFQNGLKNGQGRQESPTEGWSYEGAFKDDQYHGEGAYTSVYGDRYTGSFARGKYNGYGEMRYQQTKDDPHDHHAYYGEWKDNEYYGKGILEYTSGEIVAGTWEDIGDEETALPIRDVIRYLNQTYQTAWSWTKENGRVQLYHD